MLTTTIGAYPKPDYVTVPDWFRIPDGPDSGDPTGAYTAAVDAAGAELEAAFVRGTHAAVRDQVAAGIDIPTDGEIRRENYIHYHCRHLEGIDFHNLTERTVRGVYKARLPTVTGPIAPAGNFLARDWRIAQAATDRPVKITMPGPMTMSDTLADNHYGDQAKLGADIARAINAELRDLAAAGCCQIQVDEPVFARRAEDALKYGFDNLNRCFEGVPDGVTRIVHMCCGYPDRIDNPDYPKAPKRAYLELAEAIDGAPFHQISLEDAHRYNDLADLLPRFRNTTVVLGVVAIAKSRVETVAEIGARLTSALQFIDAERLVAAPDCGLGLLGRDLALTKLRNLTAAAHALP